MIYLLPLVVVLFSGCGVNNYQAYINSIEEANKRPMVTISCEEGETCLRGQLTVYERPIVPTKPRDIGEQIGGVLSVVAPVALGIKAIDAFKDISKPTTVTNTSTSSTVQAVEPKVVNPTVVEQKSIEVVKPEIVRVDNVQTNP